jgi:hypothetical protein
LKWTLVGIVGSDRSTIEMTTMQSSVPITIFPTNSNQLTGELFRDYFIIEVMLLLLWQRQCVSRLTVELSSLVLFPSSSLAVSAHDSVEFGSGAASEFAKCNADKKKGKGRDRKGKAKALCRET